jgi:methyl-accepting chemotaxis protein
MTIQSDNLAALRDTTSKILLVVLWLHVPIAATIGMMRGAGWLAPAALTAAMALAATVSWRVSGSGLSTRRGGLDGQRVGICRSARRTSLAG